MATIEKGTVLTCGHEGCDCQVSIDEACNCPGIVEGSSYTCACGAPLVEKTEPAPLTGGEVLTCGHPGCRCAVRIAAPCDCPGAGDHYTCICGWPLAPRAA